MYFESFANLRLKLYYSITRVAPGSLFHQTTAPTRVGEYSFPAQSLFVANLSFISHDPRHIHQPATFNPDRWIDKDGR